MLENYGLLSLLPMAVAITLVLVTKRTATSLLIGTLVGAVLLGGRGFLGRWMEVVYRTLGSELWIWVMLLVGCFGSLVALFEASGGIHGFTKIAVQLCKNERRSLLVTCLLSVVIFVDDYLAILAVGATMRRSTDRFQVPREMLAFLICSVSAAACVMFPVSSWGMFVTSQLVATGICSSGESMAAFLRLIPFLFYPILMVLCGCLYGAKVLPVFGPMKTAYLREQCKERADQDEGEEEPLVNGKKPSAWNLFLPILAMTGITLAVGDALYGVFGCIVFCALLYLPQRLMTVGRFLETLLAGFRDMLGILFIVGIAFLLRDVNDLLGMPEFIIGSVGAMLPVELLPVVAFLIAFALGFSAGNFWGVCAMSAAVLIPMAQGMGGNLLLTLGAVVSGIVASCNACFFASQATLAASVSGIDNTAYAKTALPLQGVPFGLSAAAYLAAGYLLH